MNKQGMDNSTMMLIIGAIIILIILAITFGWMGEFNLLEGINL